MRSARKSLLKSADERMYEEKRRRKPAVAAALGNIVVFPKPMRKEMEIDETEAVGCARRVGMGVELRFMKLIGAACLVSGLFQILAATAPGLPEQGGELRFCVRAEPEPASASGNRRYCRYRPLSDRRGVDQSQPLHPETGAGVGGLMVGIARQPVDLFSSCAKGYGSPTAHRLVRQMSLTPSNRSWIRNWKRRWAIRSRRNKRPCPGNSRQPINITFDAPIADFVSLFDQLPILSSQIEAGEKAVLGSVSAEGI